MYCSSKTQSFWTLLPVLELIENLTLALCKCQKWKERVKSSNYWKFGDLILKSVTLVRFLKPNKKNRNSEREFIGVCMGSAMPCVKFSVLKLFNINSPNFQHLLTFTCSFPFCRLQRETLGFQLSQEPWEGSIPCTIILTMYRCVNLCHNHANKFWLLFPHLFRALWTWTRTWYLRATTNRTLVLDSPLLPWVISTRMASKVRCTLRTVFFHM